MNGFLAGETIRGQKSEDHGEAHSHPERRLGINFFKAPARSECSLDVSRASL